MCGNKHFLTHAGIRVCDGKMKYIGICHVWLHVCGFRNDEIQNHKDYISSTKFIFVPIFTEIDANKLSNHEMFYLETNIISTTFLMFYTKVSASDKSWVDNQTDALLYNWSCLVCWLNDLHTQTQVLCDIKEKNTTCREQIDIHQLSTSKCLFVTRTRCGLMVVVCFLLDRPNNWIGYRKWLEHTFQITAYGVIADFIAQHRTKQGKYSPILFISHLFFSCSILICFASLIPNMISISVLTCFLFVFCR